MKRKNTLIQYSAAPPVEEEEPESEAVVVTLAANISEQQGKIMSSLETLKGDYVPKAELVQLQADNKALLARVDKLETKPPGTIEVLDEKPYPTLAQFCSDVKFAGVAQSKGMPLPERLVNYVAGHANEGDDSQGGFLVPQEFIPDLFKKEFIEESLLPRCTNLPVSGNSIKLPAVSETSRQTGSRWGGVTGAWAAEMAEKTATKPTFEQIEMLLKKFYVFGYASDELIEDCNMVTFASILETAFREEANWMIEDSLINGTGVGQPLGILIAASLVQAPMHASQAPARLTVIHENIVEMKARIWPRSWMNSVWLIGDNVEQQLNTMSLAVGAGGGPTYLPPGGLSVSPYGTLMGRPVIPCEHCPALGAVGDIILADFSQYATITKNGRFDSSMHLRFNYDETAFRLVSRIDGQPFWRTAVTTASGTLTKSPFVALAIV